MTWFETKGFRFHGDTSKTFLVGNVDAKGIQLVDCAKKALDIGIKSCQPFGSVLSIGKSIRYSKPIYNCIMMWSEYITLNTGYSICNEYTGHGIGADFHEAPLIYHAPETDIVDVILEPGMVFTIG